MHFKKISEAAQVSMGYTFRTALHNDTNGQIAVLQARNILEDDDVDIGDMVKISDESFRTRKAFIQKGDVLLTSRGVFRAAVFDHSVTNIIASSSLYILRPKNNEILSHYLAIYLNSPIGQKKLEKISTGATIANIRHKNLEDFLIPLPTLERQQRIIDIFCNWRQRNILMRRKTELEKHVADGAISTLFSFS